MCFYKANKPPCVCKTRYLARPCWRATFYRSNNSNPNPIVRVCGVVETATDVPPCACHECESHIAKLVEARAAAQVTKPPGRRQRQLQRRRSAYGPSHGLSRSVLSSSLSCPETLVRANVVEKHKQKQKQSKTPQSRKTSNTTKVLPFPSRRANPTTRQTQEKPQQKQAQQPQPVLSVTEPTPTETMSMSEFFDFSSFDDTTTISLPAGSSGSTGCIRERLNPTRGLETKEDPEQQQQQSVTFTMSQETTSQTPPPPQIIDPRLLSNFDDIYVFSGEYM